MAKPVNVRSPWSAMWAAGRPRIGRAPLPCSVALVLMGLAAGCDANAEQSTREQAPVETSNAVSSAASSSTGMAVAVESSMATIPATETTSVVESEIRTAVADALGDRPGGVALLVVRGGVSTEIGMGVRNDVGDPMTASTPSRVASLSKPFIATIILQLFDEGRVDLDAPLGDYLPDSPVGTEVTIRDLLRHRSGHPEYFDRREFVHDVFAERERRFEPSELFTYVESVNTIPPGTHYGYRNTNYVLLGQLIEHLDGVDLNTALRNRITGPLGLTVTRFDTGEAAPVAGLASAWSPAVVEGKPTDPYTSIATGAWAAGALVSTTAELAAFLTALFGGELISDAALSEMTDVADERYGLGLMRFGDVGTSDHFYGHPGAVYGYLSNMWIQPSSGDLIVVLVNNDQIDIDELVSDIISVAW